MKQSILSQFPWPWLPAIALVIFFALFVGLLAITGLKTRQTAFAAASRLPMDDGTPDGQRGQEHTRDDKRDDEKDDERKELMKEPRT